MPPRPSAGRSSFAIAMKDYTFIRPGIAVTISGAALVLALVMGLVLIRSLGNASRTVERGARAVQLLHAYNAGLEVWRDMATNPDPAYRRPQAVAQRDSLRRGLQDHLGALARTLPDTVDQELVRIQPAHLNADGLQQRGHGGHVLDPGHVLEAALLVGEQGSRQDGKDGVLGTAGRDAPAEA